MQSPKLSSRYNISSAVLLAGIVLALYLCYRLAIPFLSPLVWSFTLAVLFRPLCRRLGIRWGSESAAASATVVLVAILVVIPLIFIFGAMLGEAVRGAGLLSSAVETGAWHSTIDPIRGFARPYPGSISGWISPTSSARLQAGSPLSALRSCGGLSRVSSICC